MWFAIIIAIAIAPALLQSIMYTNIMEQDYVHCEDFSLLSQN